MPNNADSVRSFYRHLVLLARARKDTVLAMHLVLRASRELHRAA